MMLGNIHINWRETHAQYYRELDTTYSSLHWTSMITQKLWQVAWDQWDHWNEVLPKSENYVSLAEIQKVTSRMQEELSTGIQGTLHRYTYPFQEHGVANTLLWPIEKHIKWPGKACEDYARMTTRMYTTIQRYDDTSPL
jgi:hypothetical protein